MKRFFIRALMQAACIILLVIFSSLPAFAPLSWETGDVNLPTFDNMDMTAYVLNPTSYSSRANTGGPITLIVHDTSDLSPGFCVTMQSSRFMSGGNALPLGSNGYRVTISNGDLTKTGGDDTNWSGYLQTGTFTLVNSSGGTSEVVVLSKPSGREDGSYRLNIPVGRFVLDLNSGQYPPVHGPYSATLTISLYDAPIP